MWWGGIQYHENDSNIENRAMFYRNLNCFCAYLVWWRMFFFTALFRFSFASKARGFCVWPPINTGTNLFVQSSRCRCRFRIAQSSNTRDLSTDDEICCSWLSWLYRIAFVLHMDNENHMHVPSSFLTAIAANRFNIDIGHWAQLNYTHNIYTYIYMYIART